MKVLPAFLLYSIIALHEHVDCRLLPLALPAALTLSFGDTTAPAAQASAAAQEKPVKVLFDHDGGVDDLIALLALLAEPKVDVVGITVLPADCIGEVAFNTTLKILQFTGQTNIPVGLSTLTGQHEFPMQYRVEPLVVDMLPMLNGPAVADAVLQAKSVNTEVGQKLFAKLLLAQQEPINVVATGKRACRSSPAVLPGCKVGRCNS
jgi:purine nucleosidase